MAKQDWSPRRPQGYDPDLIRDELRRQLRREFGWSEEAVDDLFDFFFDRRMDIGGSRSAHMLLDLSKAFAATKKIYPLAGWQE